MLEDKIINNSFDNVEYGTEMSKTSGIAISPLVSDRYEESISDNIEDLYLRKRINEKLIVLYEHSPFYEKYGKEKKLEKADIPEIYYTFKSELRKDNSYTLAQIFCAIAEFFELNYKTLYNDIISLEDKAEILENLRESYGLDNQMTSKSKRLF